jgi:hypothetical protein
VSARINRRMSVRAPFNYEEVASDPTSSNDIMSGYRVGDRWINTATGEEFACVDATAAAAVWTSTTATSSLADGDYGDIVVSGSGSVMSIDAGAVGNTEVAAGIDAAKIADGSVSNTEFQYVNGVTSGIQGQLDGITSDVGTVASDLATHEGLTGTSVHGLGTMSTETATNYIAKAFLDAKGDLVTATADNTPAILSAGTDGYVLTADSGQAKGIKWAPAATGSGDALTSDSLAQFAPTTSAELAGVISDETGTGLLVFNDSPTLITPALGTPSALVGTNITGTASGLSIGGNAATATLASTVTVADAAGDTTTFPMLAGSATGSLPVLTDPGLSYNATTNALTATTFVGALTGNADTSTNTTGNAATVTTNANLTGPITSVGNATTVDPTAITGQTVETSIASDDLVLISDTSASGALRKMTRANFVAGLGGSLADGDYGDIVVSSSGAAINIDSGVLPTAGRNFIGLTSVIAEIDSLHTTSTDIASSGTTDLSTATGQYVTITGTTTITAFGTCAAGVIRKLKFTSALTLTYNASSLILPGAANLNTIAGDTAEFVSLGSGNWRCFSYLRAGSVPFYGPSVSITGGSIDGTHLGATTPSDVHGTYIAVHPSGTSAGNVFTYGTGNNITIIGSSNSEVGCHAEAYGSSGKVIFEGVKSNGTFGSPTNVTANNVLVELCGGGRDSGGGFDQAKARYFMAGNAAWTGTTQESYHCWHGTLIASTSTGEWMRLVDKNLLIGGTTTMTGTGGAHIFGTTDASSSTTGALLVDGGVGIAKKCYIGTACDVGTTLNVGTTSTFNGNITIADAIDVVVDTTTGTKIGTSVNQKIGFWNKTPVIQQAGANQVAMAAYAAGTNGLDTGAHMSAMHALLVAIRLALVNTGIIKGAA